MKKWLKTLIGITVTIIFLATGIFSYSYLMLQSNLPEYEGEESVAGLETGVEVFRDNHAIPYIYANSRFDAAFSTGYLHAQERMFQMDVMRRAGAGRLSEIFGTKTVNFDKMFRTLQIGAVAEKAVASLEDDTKKMLEAYANGINEYLRLHPDKLGVEFDVLDYAQEEWTIEHSLIISKLLAWELNISWWVDVSFSNLLQKLGESKLRDILPDFPENAPTIIPGNVKSFSKIKTDFIQLDKDFREFIGFTGTHIGSNNWVAGSTRSESGKPVIANDPHLSFQVPGKWYFVSVNSPEWNVTGFTLPGVPFVIIGKNNSISWVVTNVMADDADFYAETLDDNKLKYQLDNNWEKLSIVNDTIQVKDSQPVEMIIRKTHRGPIISNIHNYSFSDEEGTYKRANLSMRWTALEFHNDVNSIYKINKSSNWKEFKSALSKYSAPGQNFVFADSSNIGYVCAAKLPKRYSNSPTFVYDGKYSSSDWNGFVKFSEMPKFYNPKKGYIASANNKAVKNFNYHISNLWEPASRINRIRELLDSKEKHSVKDFKDYQNDFYSDYAKEITKYILKAFKNINIKDENLNRALEQISRWNFVMEKENQAPAIYEVFFNQLLRNIFLDEMGEKLFNDYVFIANVPYRTVQKLLAEKYSSWFDNVSTEDYETRDEIIRKSMVDALAYLEKNVSPEIAEWQWGRIHKVKFKHLFSGENALIDDIINVGPFEIGGSGTTIFNTEYSLSKPYQNKLGPSMRYIFDFAEKDIIEMILPTGQSGHFLSEHYSDMTNDWLNGKYYKVNTNENFVKNSDYKKLVLIAE
ncbi:MAG: penicillin acylase family protein [Rhodothermaceae bacterium]